MLDALSLDWTAPDHSILHYLYKISIKGIKNKWIRKETITKIHKENFAHSIGLGILCIFSIFCDFSFQLQKPWPFKFRKTSEAYLEPSRTSANVELFCEKIKRLFLNYKCFKYFHKYLSHTFVIYILEWINLNSSSITPWFILALLDSYLTRDTAEKDNSNF